MVVAAFSSFAALAERHQQLLPKPNSNLTLGSVSTETIKDFIADAAASGTHIVDPRERREIQKVIRFWTAELITRGELDWSPPVLSDAQVDIGPTAEARREPSGNELNLDESRALVRIAASARQWRESGDPGWLLKGDALREAQRFARRDDTIQALVDASQKAELRASHRQRWVLSAIILTLAILCSALAWKWQQAVQSAETARVSQKFAEESAEKARLSEQQAQRSAQAAQESEQQARQSEKAAREAQATANQSAQSLSELYQQLQAANAELAERGRAQQRQLDEQLVAIKRVAELMQRLRNEGKINNEEIPEEVRKFIGEATGTATTASAPDLPPDTSLPGYDPSFLQSGFTLSGGPSGATNAIPIPLPKLTAAVLPSAYDGGRVLNYVNFSLVLNEKRRMAFFSAANLQRSALLTTVRPPDRFGFDMRVARDAQLSPDSFRDNDLDRARFVSAREIAWGPAFSGDAVAVGQKAYGMVNVMTNVAPLFDTFNRGLWATAQRYAQEQFSLLSDRVVIFSGPVFSDKDPVIDDIIVPQRFWKVLVAARPDNPGSLIVEAYLFSQVGDDGAKIPASTRFIPPVYLARVTDIERLTGLDFGEIVRAADTLSARDTNLVSLVLPAEAKYSAQLRQAVGSDKDQRRNATQALLNTIRDERTAESDLRTLVENVVTLAGAKSFGGLSPEARVNVLTLLREVPKARWDADRWIGVKALARRAVADASVTLGGCKESSEACDLIAAIKPNLDWALAAGRTVFVQFAGMVRNDVKAIADKLKMLDWSIPGEERTVAAAGYNEIRYTDTAPDDRRAAALLAADLRALGRSTVRAVKADVKSGTLEIWLSI